MDIIYYVNICKYIYIYTYRPGDQAPWKTATGCIILEAGPPLTNQRITPRRRPTHGTVITKRKKKRALLQDVDRGS